MKRERESSGRVGLAMSERWAAAGGTQEDRVLADALVAEGLHAEPFAWDGVAAGRDFDVVVIRSCWDYHLRPKEFLHWLDGLAAGGVDVRNPAPVVRWNHDKRYLLELAQRGVAVVPTTLVEGVERQDWPGIAETLGADRLVAKPTVGATAHGCRRVDPASSPPSLAASKGPWLVQPFVAAVVESGEWSLVWLAGAFSHAALKRPRPGDYRVQSDWGGTSELVDPPPELVRFAESVVAAFDADLLYARVDLVVSDGRPLLMELELIEPELFLRPGQPGLGRLVEALRWA